MKSPVAPTWLVCVAGVAIAACYVLYSVGSNDWDPTVMLAEGEDAHVQLEYAERQLGQEVATRPFYGHDGKFFFITANDPLLLEPHEHAAYLDRPVYRSQRVLYPALAGGFGTFSPWATVWGMVVVNVLAVGVGTFGTALVAQSMGVSRWLGLAFPINFGVLAEIDIDGGGVVALAFAVLGVGLFLRGKEHLVPLAFSASVLSRETMLLFVAGFFLWILAYRRKVSWRLLIAPGAAVVLWRLYVLVRMRGVEAIEPLNEEFARSFDPIPFRGLLANAAYWNSDSLRLLVGVVVLAFAALFVLRAWRSSHAIAWAAGPFVVLAIFLSDLVWREPHDIARAVAPLFIAYPLLLLAKRHASEHRSPQWSRR